MLDILLTIGKSGNTHIPNPRLKKDNKTLSSRLTESEKKLTDANKEIDKMKKSITDQKKVSDNNLKYLINVDRNSRRQNVIIFGVKEDETPKIGDKTPVTDLEKRYLIFEYLKLTDLLIIESIRFGKEETGKRRPL